LLSSSPQPIAMNADSPISKNARPLVAPVFGWRMRFE